MEEGFVIRAFVQNKTYCLITSRHGKVTLCSELFQKKHPGLLRNFFLEYSVFEKSGLTIYPFYIQVTSMQLAIKYPYALAFIDALLYYDVYAGQCTNRLFQLLKDADAKKEITFSDIRKIVCLLYDLEDEGGYDYKQLFAEIIIHSLAIKHYDIKKLFNYMMEYELIAFL